MSLKFEQFNSLKMTKQFLTDLLYVKTRPRTVKEMQDRARHCLRHYPLLKESGEPIFSNDKFKK